MNTSHIPLETLIDYLHHELAPGDDAVVMAHVATCRECRALYDEQTQLTEALRAYGAATERELPAGVVARIWDAVERQRQAPTFMESFAAWFRPMVTLPIAAVLVLALYVGLGHPKFTGTVATIDAAYYIDDHAALTGTVPFSEASAVPPSLENDETGSDQHWVASTGASDVAEAR